MPLEVALMMGLNFGGGSEFTAIWLWTSPPHLLLIVAMSFLVNCRHILMGAALAPYLQHLPRRRVLPALFFRCDESWALADARRSAHSLVSLPYYLGVCAGLYTILLSFTALGAFLGPTIGELEHYGFGMAFTAVFLVLLRGMWRGRRNWTSSVTSSRPWKSNRQAAKTGCPAWERRPTSTFRRFTKPALSARTAPWHV